MLSKRQVLILGVCISIVVISNFRTTKTIAQLPTVETPEEILRTEIIIAARSPIDGKPLSAAEYAEVQFQLQTRRNPPKLSPKVRETVFLLRLRQLIRTFAPFLPI